MTKTKETATDDFVLTLTIGADAYSVSGVSILEALKKISPASFGKGYAEVTIEYKGKKTKLPIKVFPMKLRRIFGNEWEMKLFAKRLDILR